MPFPRAKAGYGDDFSAGISDTGNIEIPLTVVAMPSGKGEALMRKADGYGAGEISLEPAGWFVGVTLFHRISNTPPGEPDHTALLQVLSPAEARQLGSTLLKLAEVVENK